MQYIDCLINPLTRTVQYPGNTTIVQRDTNVEVLRFHYSLGAQHELENDSIRIMVASGKEVRGFQAENVRTELNDGGDEELVFEHTITSYETSKAGQITVSVCGNKVTGNTITEAWHTLNMAFQVANAIHTESDEGEDTPETAASNAEKIAALQTLVDAITSGRPIPVDLKSKMTDTSAIYLYTGNETEEQHNYWYYHDGTTWVPGSEYGGMTIDDELSSTSENAVKNKVIKANFDEVNGRLHGQSKLDKLFLSNELPFDGTEAFVQNNQDVGAVCPITPQTFTGYGYLVISGIPKGTIFTVRGTTQGASRARLWAWLDSEGHLLSKADVIQSDVVTVDITAPVDNATVIINVFTAKEHSITIKGIVPLTGIKAEFDKENVRFNTVTERMTNLSENISAIDGNFRAFFESGYVGHNAEGFVYSNNNNRIRTLQGCTVNLKVGDVVGLSDYSEYRYYTAYYDDELGTYNDHGWRTSDLNVGHNGKYVFMLAHQTDAVIDDVMEVAKLFKVYKADNALAKQGVINTTVASEQGYQKTVIEKNNKVNNVIFPRFESGMVTTDENGFAYNSDAKRVRLIRGETLHLYAGDKIGLTDYSELRIYLCRFDTTTQTYKITGWRTKDLTVYPDGEGDYTFAIGYQSDKAITDIYAVANKLFVQRTNKPERLKVVTFNIGHFAYGGGSQTGGIYERYGIPSNVYTDRLKNWKNFFSKASADIAFIQEYSRCLDRVTGASDETGSVSTLENLFQYLYPYNIVRRNPNGAFIDNCLFSTYQLIDYKLIPLGSVENQSRVWADYARIAIGNRTVALVNVHLYAGETNTAKRAENISDLIDTVEGEKYVIICGDTNIYSASELHLFVDAGYSVANTGNFYGDVATYNTNVSYLSNLDETAGQEWTDSAVAAGTSLYLDNIITTPNILVQSFEPQFDWYGKLTSDHVAVIANLVIV